MLARFRRLIETALPWFDVEAERQARVHTQELESRLTKAIPKVEQIRADYRAMDRRIHRR